MHVVHRCSLFLQMLHVAWSIRLCVCLYVRYMDALCKSGWTDWDVILGLTHVGPRNHLLDKGQDQTNPFATMRPDMTATQRLAKLLYCFVVAVIALMKYLSCCVVRCWEYWVVSHTHRWSRKLRYVHSKPWLTAFHSSLSVIRALSPFVTWRSQVDAVFVTAAQSYDLDITLTLHESWHLSK